MSPEVVLEKRGLTKEFRGFTTVDSVDLRVQAGHIHALTPSFIASSTHLTDRCSRRFVRMSLGPFLRVTTSTSAYYWPS